MSPICWLIHQRAATHIFYFLSIFYTSFSSTFSFPSSHKIHNFRTIYIYKTLNPSLPLKNLTSSKDITLTCTHRSRTDPLGLWAPYADWYTSVQLHIFFIFIYLLHLLFLYILLSLLTQNPQFPYNIYI